MGGILVSLSGERVPSEWFSICSHIVITVWGLSFSLNFSAYRFLDEVGRLNLKPKHCDCRLVVTNSQESFMFLFGSQAKVGKFPWVFPQAGRLIF